MAALLEDYNGAETGRSHAVINLHIVDYADFISQVFEAAGDLGDA